MPSQPARFGFTPPGSNAVAHTWPGGWRAWVDRARWMFVQNADAITAELADEAAAVFSSIESGFPSLRLNDGGRPLSRGFHLPADVDPIAVRDVIGQALSAQREAAR